MDPLGDQLTTHPIETGWDISIEAYLSRHFGCTGNRDNECGNGSVVTRTRTESDSLEPLPKLGESATEDVGSCDWQLQWLKHKSWRMRQVPMREDSGSDWSWTKWRTKPRAHLKRVSTDPTPLPNTHKLAIDHRSPTAANLPPEQLFYLPTAPTVLNRMSTKYRLSTSATTVSSGCASLLRAGVTSHVRFAANFSSSACTGPSASISSRYGHDQRQHIVSFAFPIAKQLRQILLPGTLGVTVWSGVDCVEFTEVYETLSFRTATDPAV